MARHSVKIAGKEHELRYTPKVRREIERARNGVPLISIMLNGDLDGQAAVLWGGLKHADRRLTVDRVVEMLDEHLEGEHGDYQDVVYEAYLAVIDSRILGEVHRAGLTRAFRETLGIYPPSEDAGEEGPDPGGGKDPMKA